jgi:protein TonB
MFRDVVEPSVNVGGKRTYTFLVSLVGHTFVIAAAIIVPLVATDSDLLPTPSAMITFVGAPRLPPPPPAPRGDTQRPVSVTNLAAAPVEAPQEIMPENPIQSTTGPLAVIESGIGIVPGGEYSAPPTPPASPSPPPPPPVSAHAPVRPGGDIKPPVKVKDVAPLYPAIAQAAQVQGVVIIEATIGPTGKVQDARVLRSIPLLDAAALDAVRRWEYTPTLLNGEPIALVITVTVDFRLR